MVWPFGRRSGKAARLKEGRATAVAEGNRPVAATSHDVLSSDALRHRPSRRSSRRKRRSSRSTASMRDVEKGPPVQGEKLPLDAPIEKDYARRRRSSTEELTALPLSKRLEQSPHLRPITKEYGISYNFQPNRQSYSYTSLPPARDRGKLQRPQSLQRKHNTSETAPIRRKSSKRRKNDQVREEEIRAMSMPLPQKRSAGSSGGMLRRDSKKVKGALNRHFERPTSNISLPLEDSIHSSMSGNSETRAWRVSALDMFSPRPTIRCSIGSQHFFSGDRMSPESQQEKYETRKSHRRLTSREEKELKRTSRIDDLADALDAGALRDILERDQRRREKKRKSDEERLRRRLERRAEKQKAAEQAGTPATPRREARGAVGLGIERETSATPMEDVRPTTPPQPKPQPMEFVPSTPQAEDNAPLPTPLESPFEEPVVADAHAVRYSRASVSPNAQTHARGPSNVSEMPALLSEIIAQETPVESVEPVEPVYDPNASGSLLQPVQTADTTVTSKKGSSRRRSSDGRRMGVFASLFRRGRRPSHDQARTTPSEVSFSNTSRESMSRQPLPAHLVAPATQPIQIKRPSSVPHRTMSKFREDLPEYPLSPPDSRMQSPEVASASPIATRRRSQPLSDLRIGSNSPGPSGRTDSPVSPSVPPAGLMSQSLASVDSEGSWLSGKPMKRVSNKSHIRSSVGSANALNNQEFNASYEELGIPDDEYFKRLTPQPDEHRKSTHSAEIINRKPSSTAMALDMPAELDYDGLPAATTSSSSEEELVKDSVGRQPTIVHRQARVKSTEALLSYFSTGKPSQEGEKPTATQADEPAEQDSPTSEGEPVFVQRAKSVDLGKHHSRQLSAGSAKLLDIPARRASTDPKRSSIASRSATPNSNL